MLQPTFDNREVKGSKSEKVSEEDCLLWIAASVEQCSDHPLARALREAAVARNMTLIAFPTSSYHNHIGHGVRCESQHGRILVGSRGILESNGIPITSIIDSAMWDLEVQGKTAICVAFENIVVGVVAIADVAKPESLSTIAMLRSMKIDVWMLTGDSKTTAEALADELDIPKDRVMACCLPKDKIAKVIELQEKGECVAMVGDGINDSPALAQADVGIAIGTGTEVAIEAADMVLIRDNMHDLVVAIDLARLVFARIKQNLLWAVVYNFVAVPYAAGVWFPWTRTTLHPQYAGLAMALSSVSVVISSMALKLYKRPANLSNKENFVDSRSAGTMFTR